jgi:DNA-binding phage protein
MPARHPPARSSPTVTAIRAEATRQGTLAHHIAREAGIGLATAQRVLAGEGSPTIDTLERVAKVLGMVIIIEKR